MNTSYPPPHPVPWRVTDPHGAVLGIVVAQLWSEARAEAAIVFARDDLTVEPLRASQAPSGATTAVPVDRAAAALLKGSL